MLTNDSDSTRIRIQSTKTDEDVSSPRKSLSCSEPSNRSSLSSRFLQANNLSPSEKPLLVHHTSEIAALNFHQQQLLNGKF